MKEQEKQVEKRVEDKKQEQVEDKNTNISLDKVDINTLKVVAYDTSSQIRRLSENLKAIEQEIHNRQTLMNKEK